MSTLNFIEPEKLTAQPENESSGPIWYAEADFIEQFLAVEDDFWSLRIWLDKENNPRWASQSGVSIKLMLMRSIASIDEAMNAQVNAILHHDLFQKLEASWRGLGYLTAQLSNLGNEQNCKIKVINLTWKELSRDITRAIEFDQSDFFKLVYGNEFNMPGGEPFGLLVGDYTFSHKPQKGLCNDVDVLKGLSHTAAASFAPFVLAAEPSLFGVDHFSEMATVNDITSQFSLDEYVGWRSLRAMEDARFLGVVIPHVLMRTPYEQNGSRNEAFYFKEEINDPQTDHLWGNAAYGFAAVVLKAFTESGWFAQIRGIQPGLYKRGLVYNLAATAHPSSKAIR